MTFKISKFKKVIIFLCLLGLIFLAGILIWQSIIIKKINKEAWQKIDQMINSVSPAISSTPADWSNFFSDQDKDSNNTTENFEKEELTPEEFEKVLSETKEITPADFTPEQLQLYYNVYKDPFVLHLRKALNGYLDGTNEGMDLPEAVIEKRDRGNGRMAGLEAFDKSYYKSKFVVLFINNSLGGGRDIEIVFQDKPDRIFWAWVYRFGTDDDITGYDLRGFSEFPKSPQEQAILLKKYKYFFSDKERAL